MLPVLSSAASSCAWRSRHVTPVPPRMLYTQIRMEYRLRSGRLRWNSTSQEIFGGLQRRRQTGSRLRIGRGASRVLVSVPAVTLLERTSRGLLLQVSPPFLSPENSGVSHYDIRVYT